MGDGRTCSLVGRYTIIPNSRCQASPCVSFREKNCSQRKLRVIGGKFRGLRTFGSLIGSGCRQTSVPDGVWVGTLASPATSGGRFRLLSIVVNAKAANKLAACLPER